MTNKQQVEQGDRLKKIRHDLGHNQIQMAEILEITQPQLSRLEKGFDAVSVDKVLILIHLGYSANWFIAEVGAMKIEDSQVILPLAADSGEMKYLQEKERRLAELEAFIKEKFPDFKP